MCTIFGYLDALLEIPTLDDMLFDLIRMIETYILTKLDSLNPLSYVHCRKKKIIVRYAIFVGIYFLKFVLKCTDPVFNSSGSKRLFTYRV